MSCGCDGQCGGLQGLMGATENCGGAGMVPAGSQFRVGFRLGVSYALKSPAEMKGWIQECLSNAGYFYGVDVAIAQGWTSHYYTITGRTSGDFGDKQDIGGAIAEALTYCIGSGWDDRDPVCVDSIPQNYANVQGIVQPGAPDYRGAKDKSGKCDWKNSSLGDALACELGISKNNALAVGAIGVFAVVLLVLKR